MHLLPFEQESGSVLDICGRRCSPGDRLNKSLLLTLELQLENILLCYFEGIS